MCLDLVIKENLNDEGVGYKVVYKREGVYYPLVFDTLAKGENHVSYELEQWYDSIETVLDTYNDFSKYMAGFHCYTALEKLLPILSADKTTVVEKGIALVEVKYTGGHTLGEQSNLDVIVCRRMKIVREIEVPDAESED